MRQEYMFHPIFKDVREFVNGIVHI